ncbi:MAG: HEPN domain-containing protein [Planctomycetota bacterium]
MKPSPEREAERWFRQAAQDLDDARYALAGARFHLTCFLAQQGAEKALKAAMYARGAEEVRGHSVARLCEELTSLEPRFSHLKQKVAFLDRYYIPTRYPNGLPDGIPAEAFRRQDAEDAMTTAEALLRELRAGTFPGA